MKILIAEDDPLSRRQLEFMLIKWGWEVIAVSDGIQALEVLESEHSTDIAIVDVEMPGCDGFQVCRRVRESPRTVPPYLILLTSKGGTLNIIRGIESGANEYITKPFDALELRVRVSAGYQVVMLQRELAERVSELEEALAQVKQLQGMLPICSYCKSVRDDNNYWQQIERYISEHTEAQFSHGICPTCYERVVRPQLDKFKSKTNLQDELTSGRKR